MTEQVQWDFGVLTISDRVSKGQAIDQSGPEILNLIKEQLRILINNPNLKITTHYKVVPDEIDMIQSYVKQWSQSQSFKMIITTGGTGFSDRDITPEAIEPLLTKKAPGIVMAMMKASLEITPHAMLSRPVAGVINSTLVVTLPGSIKAVRENLTTILLSLPHALSLLDSNPKASLPESHRSKDYALSPASTSTVSSTTTTSASSSPSSEHSHHHHHNHDHHHHHHHHHKEESSHRSSCGGNHKRGSTYPMIQVKEAIDIIINQAKELKIGTEEVNIQEALGMVTAQDISSNIDFPPFRASIKDGFAVRSKDGEGNYVVLGNSLAGNSLNPSTTIGNNQENKECVRITTGAMIPEGFDAVVMVEDTEPIQSTNNLEMIHIEVSVPVGCDIRAIGSDLKKGDKILSKGEKIGAAEIGLMATLGIQTITVYKSPSITIISTGDELVDYKTTSNDNIPIGFIRDSNSPTIQSIIEEVSNQFGESGKRNIKQYGIVKDQLEPIQEAFIKSAETSDIIITSGGVSMGQLDLVKPLLEKLGKVHFGRVNMKPGKPLTFATIDNQTTGKKTLVFALPGNPVSTMVTFYIFVLPCLRYLCGHLNYNLPIIETKLNDKIRLDPERPEYHRCLISWDLTQHCFVANSTGSQASCRLMSMKKSNALLILPQREGYLEKGTSIQAIVIGNL